VESNRALARHIRRSSDRPTTPKKSALLKSTTKFRLNKLFAATLNSANLLLAG
jgi:hypothetical protein